ncbi:hypothetical protein B9125_003864 [Escherichia coli]|nr:hypothetical protein [Escherichia coli]EFF5554645.1 hypothetical protein [Escherichia coli]
MKLKHVGMIVVSVLAMSSAAVSAAEGDESGFVAAVANSRLLIQRPISLP